MSLSCRRLLILVSCRCRVEEDKYTASAVSDTTDSLDAFGSEPVAADLLQQVRWRDDGSRCIEASQKISSHSIFERSGSDGNSAANPDEKRSNTPSKQRSEINDVLHRSVIR
jgi:hypothetical protein